MRRTVLLTLTLAASATLTHAETVTLNFGDVPGNTSFLTLPATGGDLTATFVSEDGYGFQADNTFFYPTDVDSVFFSQDLSSLTFGFEVGDASTVEVADLFEDGVLLDEILYSARPPGYSGEADGVVTFAAPRFNSVQFRNFGVDFDRDFVATTASDSGSGSTTVTPEPSTFALLGTGMLGAVGALRRKLARV